MQHKKYVLLGEKWTFIKSQADFRLLCLDIKERALQDLYRYGVSSSSECEISLKVLVSDLEKLDCFEQKWIWNEAEGVFEKEEHNVYEGLWMYRYEWKKIELWMIILAIISPF